ncbi:MAG: hypothetical protein IIA92_02905 [Chloroflexi bacterium]|nr:hypothetical protein [Chloroflexota bacterium]
MRTNAFNNRDPAWDTDNVSSLQKKVSILLGLNGFQTRYLTTAFAEAGVELLTKERFEELHGAAAEGELVAVQAGIRQRFLEVPLTGTSGAEAGRLFDDIVYLKHKAVTGPALRQGIHLDRYRVGRAGSGDSFQAIFSPDDPHDNEAWRILGVYDSEDEAVASVNALRRFLIRLNVASEGFYVLEHILLRPLGQDTHHGIRVPDDFYSFKLSVLFPGWTARFQTPEFRRLTEETVQSHCPAHIFPEFHWLDLDKMQEFEGLYSRWLDTVGQGGEPAETRNAAAKELIGFLMENAAGRDAQLEGKS